MDRIIEQQIASLDTSPCVTIAIPLYRSERFVKIIASNIKRIEIKNAEIIISDRHSEGNAIEILQKILIKDDRVRFIKTNDKINWFSHFNLLLKEARGEYFMWMPHDDSFPRRYVQTLVESLIDHPDAWLSFGKMYAVNKVTKEKSLHDLPKRLDYSHKKWHPFRVLSWMMLWNVGIAFRGVFRKSQLSSANLILKPTYREGQYADLNFMFGVGLHGKIIYNKEVFCVKRYYIGNTHGNWKLKWFYSTKGFLVLSSYIKNSPLDLIKKTVVTVVLCHIFILKNILRFTPQTIKTIMKSILIKSEYLIPKS